jgi:hypothetical protein
MAGEDNNQAGIPPVHRRIWFAFFYPFFKKFSIHGCAIKADEQM